MAPLHRALPLAEGDDRAVRVGQQLDLDVPRPLDVALGEDTVVAEGGSVAPRGLERVREFLRAADDAHAAPAAAGGGLDHEREADLLRLALGEDRHAGSRAIRFAASLSPPSRSASADGPIQVRPFSSTAAAKAGLSARKPYPGARPRRPSPAPRHDCVHVEVRRHLRDRVRLARVERAPVVRRDRGDRLEAEVPAGAEDPQGDLPAVGDEDPAHGREAYASPLPARPMRRIALVAALALLLPAAASAAPVFLVSGRGWGHGVGMSQYGAQGYAAHGWRHARILGHYYPGTRLERRKPREVRVLLAAGRKKLVVSSRTSFRLVDANGRKRLVRGPDRARPEAPRPAQPGARRRRRAAVLPRRTAVPRRAARPLARRPHVRGEPRHARALPARGRPVRDAARLASQALRAQAVVARSYTLATLRPGKLFDLYDDQRSQVYGGVRAETTETNLAVGATANRVLTYRGSVATTYYHSTSGGRTANVEDVWSRNVPYLRAVADPYDRISPHHRWGPQRLDLRPLKIRGVRDLSLVRTRSGRVGEVVLRTGGGAHPRGERPAAEARPALDLVQRRRDAARRAGTRAPGPDRARAIARNVGGAVIQRREATGWRQVARIRPRATARSRSRSGRRRRPATASRRADVGAGRARPRA